MQRITILRLDARPVLVDLLAAASWWRSRGGAYAACPRQGLAARTATHSMPKSGIGNESPPRSSKPLNVSALRNGNGNDLKAEKRQRFEGRKTENMITFLLQGPDQTTNLLPVSSNQNASVFEMDGGTFRACCLRSVFLGPSSSQCFEHGCRGSYFRCNCVGCRAS